MDLTDDAKEFPQLVIGVAQSLLHEALTDPEVMCLAASGLLLGTRRFRGIGIALGGWYLSRRADQYVGVFDSNVKLLAQVINAKRSRGVPND